MRMRCFAAVFQVSWLLVIMYSIIDILSTPLLCHWVTSESLSHIVVTYQYRLALHDTFQSMFAVVSYPKRFHSQLFICNEVCKWFQTFVFFCELLCRIFLHRTSVLMTFQSFHMCLWVNEQDCVLINKCKQVKKSFPYCKTNITFWRGKSHRNCDISDYCVKFRYSYLT